jgi:hypothetical protein
MPNSFERFPSLPEEEAVEPNEGSEPESDAVASKSSEQHPDTDGQGKNEEHGLGIPESNERAEDVQELEFEETREGKEHRENSLADVERKMRELREEFAAQYVKDQAKEIEEYYNAVFSQAENGERAKSLLYRMILDKVRSGMEEFVETGNSESIPTIHIQIQKAIYPHQGKDRVFLIGLSVQLEGSQETQEDIDRLSDEDIADHPNAR